LNDGVVSGSMGFEKVSGSSRGGVQAKISIRKSNSIGINSVALDEFFEDDEEFAEVYFDEEENRLGITGKTEKTEDSYKITRSNSGGTVAPSSFLKGNNLIPDVTTQYAPETVRHGSVELVVIDLDEPVGTHGSPDTEDNGEVVEVEGEDKNSATTTEE